MALDLVVAGDPIIPDDINQYNVFLNLVNGGDTLIKTFTGTLASSAVATIPHGIGRAPFFLLGYYSATSEAAIQTEGLTILNRNAATSQVYFGHSNVGTIKSADNTNIWVRNGTGSSIWYVVYAI